MAENQRFDAEARYAQLGERVENQGSRITHLEATVTRGFSDVADQIRSLGNDFKVNTRTPWPIIWSAIGVCFTVFFALGGALFWPIRTSMEENRLEIRRVSQDAMSVAAFATFQQNYEQNRQLFRNDYKADLTSLRDAINGVQENSVNRREFEAIMNSINAQLRQMQSAQTKTPL